MGSLGYPFFAVCVVIYNIVAALGTVLCSWLSPVVAPEKVAAADMRPAHYSLLVVNDSAIDPLMLFPDARLQGAIPNNCLDQFRIIDSSTGSIELQSSIKEDKNVAT